MVVVGTNLSYGPTGSQGFKGQAYKVKVGQGVGLEGPKGSRGRPTGSTGRFGWSSDDLEGIYANICISDQIFLADGQTN